MPPFKPLWALLGSALLLCSAGPTGQQTPHHVFEVTARRYAFEPADLEVHEGDLVRVTMRSADIPHSMVIDAYRIAKRASAGGAVTFEFLADRSGSFPFYCNLAIEDGCRKMRGRLVVRPE
jgi:plastocyanin